MPDRSELEALLGRVMVATVPSFELSNAILDVLGRSYDSGTHVTANVDAALALVERCLPGWIWEVSGGGDSAPFARLAKPRFGEIRHVAATVPLAVLAALLRALIAQSHPAEPLKYMPA